MYNKNYLWSCDDLLAPSYLRTNTEQILENPCNKLLVEGV